MDVGHLERPLPIVTHYDFPIIQYVDETLIVLFAYLDKLPFLKDTLNCFAISVGLKVNYHTSTLIVSNISKDRVDVYTNALACQLGSMLYLLGHSSWNREHLLPLVGRIQKDF